MGNEADLIILGVNAYHADASAAIFKNGELIAAIEEERLTRVKHTAGFPGKAIEFCLKEAGVSWEDITHIAVGRDPKAKFYSKVKYALTHLSTNISGIKDRFSNRSKINSIAQDFAHLSRKDKSFFEKKIKNLEHHRSHLASAFFASGYDEAACISIDGSGDFTTTMLGMGKNNKIQVLSSVDFPHSLGIFYTACTQWLGFPHYGDEYKVMGMAPYGEPTFVPQLRKMIQATDDGLFKLDMSYFKRVEQGIITYNEENLPQVATLYSGKMVEEFGAARKAEEPLTQLHKDFAASVQEITEEIIFHLLHHLHKITNCDTLCIAGGVAQNSVANGKIISHTPFKEVYVPSAGHDAGISIGAALYLQHQMLGLPASKISSPYTGSKFSNEEIENLLKSESIHYTKMEGEALYDVVSDCIIAGGVVGWFTGRAEFGPRALGGRSILADPRRADAKDILNLKIKRRESFRPFAPSILEEYTADYFTMDAAVPFMEKVYPIKEEKRALIPAVTHVNGTGRLQTVNKEVSPRYHALISSFHQKTGVPILLNTSFNENEPIVNAPIEALNCFLRTNMDMLVLENCVIKRQ